MEYVEGDDLSKLVHDGRTAHTLEGLLLRPPGGDGLGARPRVGDGPSRSQASNILLSKQGKRQVVKVIDFGLAKAKSET